MPKKLSAPFIGFLQATGLFIYIKIVTYFLTLGSSFPQKSSAEFYAPIIMLLLFIFSAVISALLVLGRAGMLFWDRKYKESFKLIGWTVVWIIFYFIFMVLLFIYSPT